MLICSIGLAIDAAKTSKFYLPKKPEQAIAPVFCVLVNLYFNG